MSGSETTTVVCALPVAIGYAALAGFSLSTLRALIMFSVLCLFWWARIGRSFWPGLACAAAVAILVDPAAPAATGFWLSFGAVAVLAGAFAGRPPAGRVRQTFRAQLAVFLGLMPLTILLGLAPSWSAPLVNLAAIPWVAVVVVSPLLAGVAVMRLWPSLADQLFLLAGWGISGLYEGLSVAASIDAGAGIFDAANVLWTLPGLALKIIFIASTS